MTIYKNHTGERFVVAGSDDETMLLFAASTHHKPIELVADERLSLDSETNDGITTVTKCVTNVMPPKFQKGVLHIVPRTVAAYMCGTGRTDFVYPDEPVVYEGNVKCYNRLVRLT